MVAGALAALVTAPVVLYAASPARRSDPGFVAFVIAVDVVSALLGAVYLWWQVRRWRRNPDVRRRQPNARASRVLRLGTIAVALVAAAASIVAREAFDAGGSVARLVGLGVLVPGWFAVVSIARRHDPRLRWFRRIEPCRRSRTGAESAPECPVGALRVPQSARSAR